ncbi:hypothetical protein [Acinetobacter sp. AS167]|uniref:hypothetical protein n=1 Tax=Acinetobacter sp. AS167 TaxID=3127884 RepID=UPI00301B3DA6
MDNLFNLWGFIKEYSGVFASLPALYYLINTLIIKFIKKDELVLQKDLNIILEREKANLNAEFEKIKAQYTQENENLKSDLQQKNIMLEIAYSGIYKDRLTSLKGIYKTLLSFENALRENNRNLGEKSETVEKCKTILEQFKNEYYENAIFLPNILDQKLENLLIKLQNSIYNQVERNQITRLESINNHELANIILKNLMEKENEVITIRYELCDSIRDIIGSNYINNNKKSP